MIGTTISHYRVLSRLGAGGMGEVWLAEDVRLGHQVAVKLLLPHLAAEREARARFLNEATAISQLQHQSIVPLLECDERDERLFIITPYCAGGALRARLKAAGGEGLEVPRVLEWGEQIASGLAEAHSRGILHRDIKPENLLLNDRQELRICDFGLAKLVDATQITRTAATMGTVGYMSPEQVRAAPVDERSDIWSLGAVLYEMATGRRPFDRENMQATMLAIASDDPESIVALRPELPEQLEWIILRCLEKDPEDRYASAKELAADLKALRRAVAGDDTVVFRAGPRRQRKQRSVSPLALGMVAILLVAGGVWWWTTRTPPQPERGAGNEPVAELTGPPRLIVTKIDNRTGDPSMDATVELVTERLAQNLAGTQLVDVVPMAGVLSALGGLDLSGAGEMGESTLKALADETGARVAITGALYASNGEFQVQGRLTEFPSGRILSSTPILEAPPDRLEAGLEEFEQRVMGGVAMYANNPFRQPLPQIPPRYEAYEHFAKGMANFDQDWLMLNNYDASMAPFLAAARVDSLFGRPAVFALLVANATHASGTSELLDTVLGLGIEFDAYESLLLEFLDADIHARRAESLGYAQRLVALYPDDVISGFLLLNANLRNQRPRQAIEAFNNIDFTPELRRRLTGAMQIRRVAEAYHYLGDYEAEREHREALVEYFPDLLLLHADLMYPAAAVGDTARIREVLDRLMTQPGLRGYIDTSLWKACDVLRGHGFAAEGNAMAEYYLNQRPLEGEDTYLRHNRGVLLMRAGRLDEAREVFESCLRDGISIWPSTRGLAFLAAIDGDRAAVDEYIAEFLEPQDAEPDAQGVPKLQKAHVAALLGDRDEAMRLLRLASREGLTPGHGWRHSWQLESLWGYPPFEELIRPRG